jgi:peptidoglycan-associated lipoprotein
MNKVTKVLIIGFSVAALAACAKKHPAGAPGEGEGGGASAYGANGSDKFQYDSNGMRINPLTAPANQTYYFQFDSSGMRPEDLRALNIQANYLAAHPNVQIRLEGNTDNRGSREYNIGLGWRRDQAVARLMEQQGVKPGQIKMLSYGKERPVAMGDSEQSWALNRRVDLKYLGQ